MIREKVGVHTGGNARTKLDMSVVLMCVIAPAQLSYSILDRTEDSYTKLHLIEKISLSRGGNACDCNLFVSRATHSF